MRAVVVERHAHVPVLVAGLPGGEQVLAPVLDPLQRRAELRRGEHDAHVLALGETFWPNPPPVSRMITLTRCSGMPSRRAQNIRTSCGDCVAAQTVSSPGADDSATMPRVSIGTAAYACW